MAKTEILAPRHIGDGVYVHDTGYGIHLAVNHHNNKVIMMDDSVIRAFLEYAKEADYIKNK